MAKKLNEESTFNPDDDIELPRKKLDAETMDGLGETAMTLIDVNLGNRSSLDRALDLWNSMYEMRVEEMDRDSPWENSANLCVPMIPTELEDFVSRISGSAILPRPFSVSGNDENSAPYAHQVEQFYNGEYTRNGWEEALWETIHLSARDGLGIVEILWELSEVERQIMAKQTNPDGSEEMVKQTVTMTKYDAPRLEPVELRDLLVIPVHAISIDDADAVCRKKRMGEQALLRLVKAGIADADRVESVLSYVDTGMSDQTYDRLGNSTYEINHRINVADTAVAPPMGVKMNRGPVTIWVVYTNQYDLDGDGVPEENVLWIHEQSRMLIGHCPFPYWQGRPFKTLALTPRPRRLYGFSIPERLRGLQEEVNAQHNSRADLLDWMTNPTTLADPKLVRLRQEDYQIGPGAKIDAPPGSIAFMQLPTIPPENIQEEMMLNQYASRVTGAPQSAASPPQGSYSGGGQQRSARAAQQSAAIQGAQTNKTITIVRRWLREVFVYVHNLYRQYGKNQMESVDSNAMGSKRISIPKEILELDYTIGVAGMGGPLDKENRRNELLGLASYLQQNPLMQGNLERTWNLTRMILETFDINEVTMLIGTQAEAKQQAEAQAQAQQQQQQLQFAMAAMNHGKVKQNAGSPPTQGN